MEPAAVVTSSQMIQTAFQVIAQLNLTAYLWPEAKTQAELKDISFDYIIVGAGTAGCVIANRLTEIEDFNVLLIEAGGDAPVESLTPILFPYLANSVYDWNYTSEYDGYTALSHKGSVLELTAGKMLGGSSSLHHLVYVRGDQKDFDSWAEAAEDETWKYENVLHYFKKSENLKDLNIMNSPYADYHSTGGYLAVKREPSKKSDKYLKSYQELGYDVLQDINSNVTLAFAEPMFMIGSNALRQSSAYSFLRPIKERKNLFLLKNTLATKIIIVNNKAVGVEAVTNDKETVVFKAKREVILSAGAFNSPQLLMLSGVGPKKHLESLDITSLVNLPVGHNLQDHIVIFLPIKMQEINSPPKPIDPTIYTLPRVLGFMSTNKSYSEYEVLNFIFENEAKMLFQICVFVYQYNDDICKSIYEAADGRELAFNYISPTKPRSRGKVLLRSSNPEHPPKIYTKYFSNDQDLDDTVKFMKDFAQIINTTHFRDVNAEIASPVFKDCGDVRLEDDEFWKCYVLAMMSSGYHYCGTCSMGSVVDGRLKVIGVEGLRVADASVVPEIPIGNIAASIIMLAEKVAVMIKEDSGNINCYN